MSLPFFAEEGHPTEAMQSQSVSVGSRAVTSSPLRRTTQAEALEREGNTEDHSFFFPIQNEDQHQQKMRKDDVRTILRSGRDHQRHQPVQYYEQQYPWVHANTQEVQNTSIHTPFRNEQMEAEAEKNWGDSRVLPQAIAASFAHSRPHHNQYGHQPQYRDHNNIVTSQNSNTPRWYSDSSYYATDYQHNGSHRSDVIASDPFERQGGAMEPMRFQQQQACSNDSLSLFRDAPRSNPATGFLPRQPQHLWQQNPALFNEQAQTPHCSSGRMLQNNPGHSSRASDLFGIGPPPMFQRSSMVIGGPRVMHQHTILPPLKQEDTIERQLENQRMLESLGLRCTEEPIKREGRGLGPLQYSMTQRSTPKLSKSCTRAPPVVPNEQILQPDSHSPFIVTMARPSDLHQLTVYQFLLRESLEYFTATQHDVDARVRGRKQKVQLSQIGIRCRYCSHLTVSARGKGAVYYPKSLINVYQAAQNIASAHFNTSGYCCRFMPPEIVHEIEIQKPRRDASKAGRSYWVEACQEVGIYEDNCSLWIKKS